MFFVYNTMCSLHLIELEGIYPSYFIHITLILDSTSRSLTDNAQEMCLNLKQTGYVKVLLIYNS